MASKRRRLVTEDFDLGYEATTIPTDSGGTRAATRLSLASISNTQITDTSLYDSTHPVVTIAGETGKTNYGVLELGSDYGDGNGVTVGHIVFAHKTNPSSYRDVATIEGVAVGGSANSRGGLMSFYCRPDGSSAGIECFRIEGYHGGNCQFVSGSDTYPSVSWISSPSLGFSNNDNYNFNIDVPVGGTGSGNGARRMIMGLNGIQISKDLQVSWSSAAEPSNGVYDIALYRAGTNALAVQTSSSATNLMMVDTAYLTIKGTMGFAISSGDAVNNSAAYRIFPGTSNGQFRFGDGSSYNNTAVLGESALPLNAVHTTTLNIVSGGSTSISSGTGTVKMSSANSANCAAWIPIKYAGTTYYVPAWTTNSP